MTLSVKSTTENTVQEPIRGYSQRPQSTTKAVAIATLMAVVCPGTFVSAISDTGWPVSGYAASPEVRRIARITHPSTFGHKEERQRTPAQAVQAIHAATGLTWDQIARFFGVSRRSVHSWAAGGRMSSINEEAIVKTAALVDKLTEARLSAYEIRRRLLQSADALISSAGRAADEDINRPARTWVEA